MIDALVALGALAFAFLRVPLTPSLDPGPSAACPDDMRLVRGRHYDEMEHLCVEPRKDARDTHCFAYLPDVSAEEGPATDVDVCMDMFEAPNVRGKKPLLMRSYENAVTWCGERGKRVCTEEEWEQACEGPDHRTLAYGWSVDLGRCNSGKTWRPFDVKKLQSHHPDEVRAEIERLDQSEPSGKFATCVSPYGVYDMMGNVEEWVTSRKGRRFKGALMGGFWSKPWTGCRGTNDAHEESFAFYETGFRCCADPGSLDARGRRIKKGKVARN
ncbi:MAG TPA: SUMF1/EgtB/PvdO family nonheme iron enzyme [Minicystis sp.]|nr:SUMF1/EgtB/PvdO family nonheme iron enzyme [Minicystis sp.]